MFLLLVTFLTGIPKLNPDKPPTPTPEPKNVSIVEVLAIGLYVCGAFLAIPINGDTVFVDSFGIFTLINDPPVICFDTR